MLASSTLVSFHFPRRNHEQGVGPVVVGRSGVLSFSRPRSDAASRPTNPELKPRRRAARSSPASPSSFSFWAARSPRTRRAGRRREGRSSPATPSSGWCWRAPLACGFALFAAGDRGGGRRRRRQRRSQRHRARDHLAATAARPARPQPAGGDPLSFRQWNMEQIRAPQARAITGGKHSVLVGVLDSGIDLTHPGHGGSGRRLGQRLLPRRRANTSPGYGRTTSSATAHSRRGVVAAEKNGVGIVGVAPGVAWRWSRSRSTTSKIRG